MEEEANWAELRGDGGLTSKHWRTRLSALQSVLALADQSPFMNGAPLIQLLDLLIFNLALSDTYWLVRKTAAECASKIFSRRCNILPMTELDHYLAGFLAISVDDKIEVQSAAALALRESTIGLGSQWLKEMVPRFVYNFVSSALHSMNILQKTSKDKNFGGISTPFDMSVMVPALEGIINVERLCRSASMPEAIDLEIGLYLLPVLAATLAAMLEECETSRDRTGASKVAHVLRSLGSSKYRQHVIFMISSELYEGTSLARWLKSSDIVNDELLGLLEKVDTLVVLKGIYVALDSGRVASDPLHKDLKNADIQGVEVGALRHIIEMLRVPSTLVAAIAETRDEIFEEKFVRSSYYHLKVAETILKGMSADLIHVDIVQDLVLRCSALASTVDKTLPWITKDIQEGANGIVGQLAALFSEAQPPAHTAKLKTNGVERLISRILPDLTSKLKSQLRDHLSENDDGNYGTSSSNVSLATAILASHQLYWCLKQVYHPILSQSCVIIMPCALMALDHHSPHVKRQAMKLFIHMTDNLNPSELRWYKDAVLDCIMRNIVGSGELWPLVVQTAIPLVLCIEGNNPRAKWYRSILDEMLGELERHQLDADYFKVWLEIVDKLFEVMGLVLVTHFKRLLSLLFPWLHSSDDSMTLLVLNTFKVIVIHTWPRMPFHAERFWKELAKVYKESFSKKRGSAIRSSVMDVAVLLKRSGGPAFDLVWQNDESTATSLGYALADHLSGQTVQLQLA